MRVAICGPIRIQALSAWLEVPPRAKHDFPRGLGGVSVTHLAMTLLRRGHELTIATLDPNLRHGVHFRGPQLSLRVGPYRPRHRLWDAFRVERTFLHRALAREEPDLIHAHWTYEFALGALAVGVPTLVTVRDWAPAILAMHPHPYRLVRLAMGVRTFAKGSWFTAVSPYIEQRLRRIGIREVALVPNGIPDEAFQALGGPTNGRAPVVIAVNHGFNRLKNVEKLLTAWPRVRHLVPDARLDLVGRDYGPGGQAHRWALERGLDKGVRFRGPVAHSMVRRLLQEADLFVHPSREESFGNVLLEAMALGVAVIGGARSGAVPWVLGDGEAGVLTDVNSASALAQATVSLLSDPTTRRTVAERGRQRAWDEFRMSRVTDQYVEEYGRVITAEKPPERW